MFDDIDDGARIGVWLVLGLTVLLLFGLLGGLGVRQLHQQPAKPAAQAPQASPAAQRTDADTSPHAKASP